MRFVRNFVAVHLKKVLQNLIRSGKFCSDKALCGVYKGLCFLQRPVFRVVKNCFAVFSRFGAVVSVCVQTAFFQ